MDKNKDNHLKIQELKRNFFKNKFENGDFEESCVIRLMKEEGITDDAEISTFKAQYFPPKIDLDEIFEEFVILPK